MDNETYTVYVPSFSFERKNGALTKYIFPFVALISMFTVSIFVGGFVVAFVSSYLKLPVSHLGAYIFVPIAAFVLSTGVLIKFCLHLLTAYKFEEDRIVRGRLSKGKDSSGVLERIPEVGAKLLFGSKAGRIAKLIRLNMNMDFVETYFDTDAYGKEEFLHPRLVGETKHELIYECDNGKKLRILKIYEDMYREEGRDRSTFLSRVIIVSLMVLLAALMIAVTDLSLLRHKTVTEYAPVIEATEADMEKTLGAYGYTLAGNGATYSNFKKPVGDRTAEVKYSFDKNGKIKNVDIQLYFDADSPDYEGEIRAVIGTMDAGFSQSELDEFIEAVGSSINGEYTNYRLKSDKYILTLGTSGEYVDIH